MVQGFTAEMHGVGEFVQRRCVVKMHGIHLANVRHHRMQIWDQLLVKPTRLGWAVDAKEVCTKRSGRQFT